VEDQVKEVISAGGRFIDRVKKFSAIGSQWELSHGKDSLVASGNFPPEVADGEFPHLTPLQGYKFFLRYIGSNIFGSQVEFLQDLAVDSTNSSQKLTKHYANFISRKPTDLKYESHQWLDFLIISELVQRNENTNEYEITELGRYLVNAVRNAKPSVSFPN
jgi:hypothetical protein